jgi:hypothetical protein
MKEREPNIVHSGLSGIVSKDGVTVEVSILRLENDPRWSLEVVNSVGTSIVWDDLFASDDDAFAEFQRTVAEEGMRAFLDNGNGNVIPFNH